MCFPKFACHLLAALLLLGSATITISAADLPKWTVPAQWKKQDGEKPMRVVTFNAGADATAIEIAVSKFPGEAGGVLANVNRWRGQVGLQPIQQDDLAKETQSFSNDTFTGYTMHLQGTANHMLGAIIIDKKQNQTWFVKAKASATAIAAHEADFISFAKSFGN